MIIPKHYENLNMLHENTMPYRSYYVPASACMGALVHDREKSDRIEFLNGNWKFRFYESIYDLQEKFYEESYDTNGFGEIPVPGIWQNFGYDEHQYTNVRYPIPLDPPYVPQDNPCGAYVHEFEYEKDEHAPKAYLNFEGVDSCFYVWLNGCYVGYSQVSHCTSEIDVTDYIRSGKNTLAVLVLKWCDGTYLEDQDKFRMTGIFLDVYLLKRPEAVLYDYFTTTKLLGSTADGLLNNFWVYILPTMISAYNMILIKTYIEQLPPALEESAALDGAGYITCFFKIILPLCKPIIATVVVFVAVGQWNSWFDNHIYTRANESLTTLQYLLYNYLNEAQRLAEQLKTASSGADMTQAMAAISPKGIRMTITVLASLPIFALYPFMQKYFSKGIMVGAVKG